MQEFKKKENTKISFWNNLIFTTTKLPEEQLKKKIPGLVLSNEKI